MWLYCDYRQGPDLGKSCIVHTIEPSPEPAAAAVAATATAGAASSPSSEDAEASLSAPSPAAPGAAAGAAAGAGAVAAATAGGSRAVRSDADGTDGVVTNPEYRTGTHSFVAPPPGKCRYLEFCNSAMLVD